MEGVLLLAIDRLSQPIVGETIKVIKFSSRLNNLTSILTSIRLVLGDVEKLNRSLVRPYNETLGFTQLLSEGEQLLLCCSRIKKWDLFSRWRYSNQLTKFKNKLINFYSHVVPLLQLREIIWISTRLNGSMEQLSEENPTGHSSNANEEDGLAEISCPGHIPSLQEFGDR